MAAFVVGAAVALCGGGLLAIAALKDTFVTARAREALVERGVVCDERFALEVSWGFSEVAVAPTRCQLVRETYAESIELPEGATATLSGLEATSLRAPSLRVYLAERTAGPPVDLGPLGMLGAIGEIGSRVGAVARAGAELAAHRPVPTSIDRVELVDGETVALTLESASIDAGEPMPIHVARARLGEIAGPLGTTASAELTAIEGTATPSTCHVEADLSVSARVPIVGAVEHATHVVLEGTALDTERPQISASVAAR